MRSIKLAPLFILTGLISFACGDEADGGDGADSPDDGAGATSGDGDGDVAGDGDGDGDGDAACPTTAEGCLSLACATADGSPMIDDFEHSTSWNLPEDGDGRLGTWEHGHSDGVGPYTGEPPVCGDGECGPSGMGGAPGGLMAGHVVFKCVDGDGWCDGGETPTWQNYASLDTLLGTYSASGANCYSAATAGYTGIRFKAKSPTSTKIWLSAKDPVTLVPSVAAAGGSYRGDVIEIGTEWASFDVPFSSVKLPNWAELGAYANQPIDAGKLISLSFVVRSVEAAEVDGAQVGEWVQPYEVHLDDIEFY